MPSQSTRRSLRIGQLAATTGLSRDSLRLYERRGLIPAPPRTEGRFREYPVSAVQRVRVIQAALDAGFTLAELTTVFKERAAGRPPCRTVRSLAVHKLDSLEREIVALTAIRDRLRVIVTSWDHKLSAAGAGEAGLLDSLADSESSLSKHRPVGSRSRLRNFSSQTGAVRSRGRGLAFLLLALLSLYATACGKSIPVTASESRTQPPVRVWGELRAIMHEGRTGPAVTLKEATSLVGQHLFAVGALSGLRGEITVDDGQIWLAHGIKGEVRTIVAGTAQEVATLLVAASVSRWQSVAVAHAIAGADLDEEIAAAAHRAGVSTNQSLPVVVEGTLIDLSWHVLDGQAPEMGARHDDHSRAAVTGHEGHTRGKLIGFFSPNAQGVFTHMGQRTHFHVILPEVPLTAHVDGVGLAAGATIRFAASAGG